MKTKKKKRNIILGLSREQQNKNRQNGGIKNEINRKIKRRNDKLSKKHENRCR